MGPPRSKTPPPRQELTRGFSDEEIIGALEAEDGNRAKAAARLGISLRRIYKRLAQMRKAGGAEPVYEIQPDGHQVKGVSSLLNKEGDVAVQWVKTKADDVEREKLLLQAVKDAFDKHPRVPVIAAPKSAASDLLACYPLGDPHVGMYSWAAETGEDFDVEIAERTLVSATQRLVASTPSTQTALIVNLGDFFHADTTENVTLRSRNQLDVDTRWARVLRIGLRVMRTIVETALTKHMSVRVINEIGNHDEHTSQLLTLALSALYEKNRRVTFDHSPARYHYHRFGKCLIGVTHGDTVKPEKLGGIMASDRPDDWGATRFRYWFTGHVHHRRVFELPGCTVESFRTLAAKDAWHAASGYRSGRDMQAIVLHKEYGELDRHRAGIEMLT